MKAQVLCIIKKFVAELKDKPGVRTLRNSDMEVECELKEVRKNGGQIIYAIEPKYPVNEKHYFELQLVERGEKNIGQIVTNFSGKKLIPRWRGKNTVGFRTSKGQLLSIVGYAVRGMVEIVTHAFLIEGRTVFLVEEGFGPYDARYDTSNDKWVISLPKQLQHLGEAAVAAMEKARCNCFKRGCRYHYALSEEEARVALVERREKQRAGTQKAREVSQSSNLSDTENPTLSVKPAVETVIEANETRSIEENKKAKKKGSKKTEKTTAPVILIRETEIPNTTMAEAMKKSGIIGTK